MKPWVITILISERIYPNCLTETKYESVPVRLVDVKFSSRILNELLRTPNCDPDVLNNFKYKHPYRNIQHTLFGINSNTRWERLKTLRGIIPPFC